MFPHEGRRERLSGFPSGAGECLRSGSLRSRVPSGGPRAAPLSLRDTPAPWKSRIFPENAGKSPENAIPLSPLIASIGWSFSPFIGFHSFGLFIASTGTIQTGLFLQQQIDLYGF